MGPSKGVKGKVRLPSPDDDGMAQDLRSAIRAKHRLVEQMKEDVKDIGVVSVEDRDGDYARGTGKRGARFPFWKIVVVVFAVAVFFAFLTGGATAAEKATRAMRHRYQLRKSLENEEKAFWRSERVLRHFGLRRLSQLRFTDEIHTGDDLFIAVRDPETHFLTVPVSHSTQIVTKRLKGGNGVTYEDVAVVSHSSYHGTAPNDGLTFESFIKAFIASGSNKGLVVALKDPRVVVAVVKALQQAVTSRSVQSPIVLHAEVLPGPRGFLPQMACVFKNASAYHDGFLWDDYDGDESTGDTSGDDNSRAKAPKPPLPKQSLSLSEFQFATANDALVPFDPVLFVRTAASRLPGAVLAPGVATGGLPCAGVEVQTNSDADAAWSYAEEVGKNGGESAAQLLADAAVHGGFRFDNFRAVRKFVKNDALRDLQVKVFNFEDKSTGAGSGDGHDAKSVSNSESAKGSPDFDSVPLPEFFAAAKAKRFKKRADGLTGEINALGVAHRKRVNGFVKAARAEILDGVSRVGNGAETKDKVETSTTPPDVPTDDASNRNNSKRRKLSQMEFEVMAEAEAAQQLARQNKFMEEVDVSANDRAAFKLNTYSYESEAFALLNIRNYGPEIGVESLRLLRNASWQGDVFFPIAACSVSELGKFHPGYLRDLINRHIGYSVMLQGNVLLMETLRVSLLNELDASRTVLSSNLRRLPRGERVTSNNVFVDPVVDNPELALEESEEESELEEVERELVGVDYGGGEEELLDQERSLWNAKVAGVAKFMKQYVHQFVTSQEDVGGEDGAAVEDEGSEPSQDSGSDDTSAAEDVGEGDKPLA